MSISHDGLDMLTPWSESYRSPDILQHALMKCAPQIDGHN